MLGWILQGEPLGIVAAYFFTGWMPFLSPYTKADT